MKVPEDWSNAYLRLYPSAVLKDLERPYVYHTNRDELYEIDRQALAFLTRCDGSTKGRDLTTDASFVAFCLSEGLIELKRRRSRRAIPVGKSPRPSLRYLELQLTGRCNLRCRHCYLGTASPVDLPLKDALRIARTFSDSGGLRLLISGGEPLLYPHLEAFLKATRRLQLRRVLITNGTLITENNVSTLDVEEIQFSLDGLKRGHDRLRGAGSFNLTMRGIQAARSAGIPVSIATMVHRGNVGEFDRLEGFVRDIGAVEWGVDAPCITGALSRHRALAVSPEEAAGFMARAFGGGYHGASGGFACGRHLMTVLPTGEAVKCGFYGDVPLGDACQALMACWHALKHTRVRDLACRGCRAARECSGGCRFRAGHPLAPDPVMCALYGIDPPTFHDKA